MSAAILTSADLIGFASQQMWRILHQYSAMSGEKSQVTEILTRLTAGDTSAEEDLLPLVYVELHRLAVAQLRSERTGHTLQATALVHEVYLRLCGSKPIRFEDRMHFFRVSAKLMRRILIDYARQRNALRRGGGIAHAPLEEGFLVRDDQLSLALEIDNVLEVLADVDPRLVQVVEMRFFAGLSDPEIAAALNISERTVVRDWHRARAWLHQNLSRQ
jgi:RNA polymerase sigma-70 factor (ECF subfamily)